MKKTVKFADGVTPGEGSSYSDNETAQLSPKSFQDVERKKKRLKKRRRHVASQKEKKIVSD